MQEQSSGDTAPGDDAALRAPAFDAPSLCGFASDLVHDMLEAGLPHGLPSRAICRYDHDHVQPRAKFDGYKDDVAAVFEGGPVTTLLAAMHHVSNLQLLFADLNRKIKNYRELGWPEAREVERQIDLDWEEYQRWEEEANV